MARCVAFTITILAFSLGSASTANAQAEDFAFRFRVDDCVPTNFDSFTGQYTKTIGGPQSLSATTPLVLPDAQMRAIFEAVERIHFFEYPSNFTDAEGRGVVIGG